MFKTVVLLVLCCYTLSHPISVVHTRERRQVDECCPCPAQDAGADALAASARTAGIGLDDCPCRPRSDDSEGASSILFPTSLGAGGPFLRPSEQKEDPKNLLDPEMSLATSVLDTLREATEEEYQDALAKDAARSAIEPNDVIPDESARNVVIIVHPRDSGYTDDSNAEPSHVQETRCVHPLGSSFGRLRSSQPNDILPEPVKFSKFRVPDLFHRNNIMNRDSSLGASNVEESIVNIDGNSPRFVHYNTPPRTGHFFDSLRDTALFNGLPRVPLNDEIDIKNAVFPHLPKLKLDDIIGNPFSDSMSQANNRGETLSYDNSHIPEKLFPPHLNLRNLMKLRDVELIPKQHKLFNKFAIPSVLKKTKNNLPLKDNNYADLFQSHEVGPIEENEKSTDYILNEDIGVSVAELKQKSSLADKDNLNVTPYLFENDQITVKSYDKSTEPEVKNKASSLVKNAIGNGFEGNFSDDKELLKSVSYIKQDLDAAGSSDTTNTPLLQKIEDKAVMKSVPENYENNNSESKNTCEQENVMARSGENGQQENKLIEASKGDSAASSAMELKKTLTSLKENFARGLAKLQKSSISNDLPRSATHDGNLGDKKINLDNQFLKHGQSNSVELPTLSGTEKKFASDISIVDLQDMANQLLSSTFNKHSDENRVNNLLLEKGTQNSEDLDDNTKSNFFGTNLENLAPANHGEAEEEEIITCPENLERKNLIDSNEKETNEDISNNEMDTGASHIIMSTSSGVIEPLDSNSHVDMLLKTEKSAETLDNLNDMNPIILQENLKNLEPSSIPKENNCVYDDDQMILAASITNPQRKLSSTLPLNDFDIIKNKQSTPDSLLKNPKLNLNSYQSKISIPSKLELIPSYSITKSKDNKERNLSRKSKPSVTLRDHNIETLPQLNELSKKIRSNTNNLLTKPMHADLNLLSGNENLNRIEDVSHNFRHNAQKAIKDLQQKLKFNLRKANTNNGLEDSYAKPQELLEDVNDKLKAIHYDFNERLSSFRDEILNSPDRSIHRNIKNNLRKNDASITPPRLRSSASSISPQEIESPSPIDKSLRQNILQSVQEIDNTNIIRDKPKTASSYIMTPLKRIPSPLRQAPLVPIAIRPKSPSALTKFLERSSSLENFDKPTMKKITVPVHNRDKSKKVTISFGTTTVPPVLMGRSKIPTTTELGENQWKENNGIFPLRRKVSGLGERLRSVSDAHVSPSELNSFRSPYSLKSEYLEGRDDFLNAQNNDCHSKSLDADSREANFYDGFSDKSGRKKLSWPKVTDNSFLSKVRDSFSTLLSENSEKDDESVESSPDMLRSASRDTARIIEEPLKENVSYRCRMVCTKES